MGWEHFSPRSCRQRIADLQRWWNEKIWYKRRVPNILFPVRNEATGNVVWFSTQSTAYGVFVTIHREKPGIVSIQDTSPHTGMAGLHIDYFVCTDHQEKEVEQIKLQLYDASVGPYADALSWEIPADNARAERASIILVPDVQAWQPGLAVLSLPENAFPDLLGLEKRE